MPPKRLCNRQKIWFLSKSRYNVGRTCLKKCTGTIVGAESGAFFDFLRVWISLLNVQYKQTLDKRKNVVLAWTHSFNIDDDYGI